MVDTIKNGSDTKVINIIYDIHKNNISNLQILSEKRDMVSELFDTAVNNARPIYKIIYEYTFLYTPPKKSRFTKDTFRKYCNCCNQYSCVYFMCIYAGCVI